MYGCRLVSWISMVACAAHSISLCYLVNRVYMRCGAMIDHCAVMMQMHCWLIRMHYADDWGSKWCVILVGNPSDSLGSHATHSFSFVNFV
jgi:hypothetical protein